MKNNIDISVIICTYGHSDRSDGLNKALAALTHQRIEGDIKLEIIIVDNGCSLDASLLLKQHPDLPNLAVIQEAKVGLSNARNAGILNAKGDILVFTDDDIEPSHGWLSSLYESHRLSAALCIGGPIIFKDQNKAFPRWFSGYFLRFLLPLKFPEKFSVISRPFYLIGANMSFKKTAFQKYGLFDTSLGRKGERLLSGEDTEFILRLDSGNVYCDPNAMVFAEIKQNRLTRKFFLKRIFWQGVSDARIFRKHGLSRFYDVDEVFFSTPFMKSLLGTFMQSNFFEWSCRMVRFLTFNFFIAFKL